MEAAEAKILPRREQPKIEWRKNGKYSLTCDDIKYSDYNPLKDDGSNFRC